ncbi:MAG: hypothetical protein Q8O33_17635, partial [Pseudomonadota bacterium]|nr:hypothetical protein [Pseudomonadota bacterium]
MEVTKWLSDVREVEIVVESRTAPDTPDFDATMPDVGFGEISRLAIREQECDVPFEGRLIALGGEMIVGPLFDEKRRQPSLGVQGIGRDV